ncbi:hypothetical protein N0Y54_43680 [Nostoc punctiforme UO1]|uniref:hypothetical protein n=1 Tax=Nostoc punctiforme TaxID=272131 RepID=UPI0030A1F9BC
MLLWFDGAAELGIYLVIVAGRLAMGKSAFAAQIAFYLAQAYQFPVVVLASLCQNGRIVR